MKSIIFLHSFFLLIFFTCERNPIYHSKNIFNGRFISYPNLDSLCFFYPPEERETEVWQRSGDVEMNDTLTRLESSCCDYYMVIKKTKLHCNYDSLVAFANHNALQILDDSSTYIAFKDRKLVAMDILDEKYRNAELHHIMPDFSELYTSTIETPWADTTTRTGLVTGYTYYVIKSGNTLALNDRWNVQRKWLPAHLQHGYRSGIAINPNNDYVIFWCIAW